MSLVPLLFKGVESPRWKKIRKSDFGKTREDPVQCKKEPYHSAHNERGAMHPLEGIAAIRSKDRKLHTNTDGLVYE